MKRPNFVRARITFLLLLLIGLATQSYAAWIDLTVSGPTFGVDVSVLDDDGDRCVLEINIGGFRADSVIIGGQQYFRVSLPHEGHLMVAGLPELPSIRRSVVVPDDLAMAVIILDSDYIDLPNMPVAPSKGHLLRSVDPQSIPYTFDSFYTGIDAYPQVIAEIGSPYILRDHRGVVVGANVFQYHPDSQVLRVYTRLVLEVTPVGADNTNVLVRSRPFDSVNRDFAMIYERHFLNVGSGHRFQPVWEPLSSMLIISHPDWAGEMQPLAAWKNQKGIQTRIVDLHETGSGYQDIFDYIQFEYQNTYPQLAYVLLVGDDDLPTFDGGDNIAADPGYALVAGDDNFPDLFVGRFSVESVADAVTQVTRTIRYERDIAATPVYDALQKGTGIAWHLGVWPLDWDDWQIMDAIRDTLLGPGDYTTIDQIYDPGAVAGTVTDALNAGRGIVNYMGPGYLDSWHTTNFGNAHVNALTNTSVLPFIHSVACFNGLFTNGTCFAEAWLRARTGDDPSGAIAAYMSYIPQLWAPPRDSQFAYVRTLVRDHQTRSTGGLWFGGSITMMVYWGSSDGFPGAVAFRNWVIFGDPSLLVRTKSPVTVEIVHSGTYQIAGPDGVSYEVMVLDPESRVEFPITCTLTDDGVIVGVLDIWSPYVSHWINLMPDPPTLPTTLTLTATGPNSVTFIDEVQVVSSEMVRYTDRSAETGMQYSGQPLNAAAVDYDSDGKKDLLISRESHAAMAWRCTGYEEGTGTPTFIETTSIAFSPAPPPSGTLGFIVADYDNDGLPDFFAASSNGHLLFRNTGGAFADVTAPVGLDGASAHAKSIGAAWGDFDRDGYLDLLVLVDTYGSGISDTQRLFRNVAMPGNERGFVDVTVQAGLPETPWTVGQTALWADLNQNGDLDLIITRPANWPGQTIRYYSNQGDGTFVDETMSRMPQGVNNFGLACLADVSRNGHLDIVFANDIGSGFGYMLNDGSGNFPAQDLFLASLGAAMVQRDLAILDFDLDGRVDILIARGSRPVLLAEREYPAGQMVYADVAWLAQLTDEATLYGVAPADFNLDGFTDLYLTRTDAGHFFYKASPNSVPQHRWTGVRLVSPLGANNRLGIGATVTIEAGSHTQIQIVDGGSGRASQREPDLVFGLGDYAGSVSATVRWPTGRIQPVNLQLDQYNLIEDDSPLIDESSVTAYLVYHIYTGTQDWVFEWITNYAVDASLDKVIIVTDNLPSQCVPPQTVLTPGMGGVDHDVELQVDGTYLHRLTWINVPCVARCNIPYQVQSGIDQFTSTSKNNHKLNIPTCPQSL